MYQAPDHIHRIPRFNNWDLDNLAADNFTGTIDDIHLCALRNELNEGDEAGEPPTNHWAMCLQTTPLSSVMLGIVPGYGSDGLRGKIETSSLSKPYTEEPLKVFFLQAEGNYCRRHSAGNHGGEGRV